MVTVDAKALVVTESEGVEVCLDRQCRPFGDKSFGFPSDNESLTGLPILGDQGDRTILIRTRHHH
ncbi:MAG: hypothetical protein GY724_12845 [Actinomycetia bacterium]|nr:hypothetical protein [Actinomycetes bacterium]